MNIILHDAKLFLSINNQYIPKEESDIYTMTWILIKSCSYKLIPNSIHDFVIADNLKDNDLLIYKTSYILAASDNELIDLTHKLQLPVVFRNRIIRILGYLNKLDNDISILPDDIIKCIFA